MTKIRSSNDSMIQDRRGQGGGLGGGGGLGFPMKAGGGLVGIIIVVASLLLPKLLGGATATSPSANVSPETPTGSGEACQTEQEQILCGAQEDVQAYWADALPQAFNQQYQPVATVFFSGFTDTGCGQASAETGPFYCPLDSLVYFDLDFLAQLQNQFGATGDLAAQYIVAHEYGHHVQNLLGINAEVNQAQQNDPDRANQYSVALELQADCFAGAWAHDAASRQMFENDQEINEALEAARAVGDDRIQQQTTGRVDPETFTHGTSEQRESWFKRGYNTGDPARCNTFDEVL